MWVMVDTGLPEHRKTKRFARLMGVDINAAIGLLIRLWAWTFSNGDADGLLPNVDHLDIADALNVEDADKLISALIGSGFLDQSESGYFVHDWAEYSGKHALKRERDRIRKQQKRAREHSEAARPADVLRTSIGCHTEKTDRKEKIISPYNPPKGEAQARFDDFYAAYPRKAAKASAQKAWNKLNPDNTLFDTIMTALEAQKHSQEWLKDNGQFIPYPASWLNGRRWEDAAARASPANSSAAPDEIDEALLEFYGGTP